MSWKIKYWYCLCGANACLTLLFTAAHNPYLVFIFAMTVGCWYMAEYLLSKEKS